MSVDNIKIKQFLSIDLENYHKILYSIKNLPIWLKYNRDDLNYFVLQSLILNKIKFSNSFFIGSSNIFSFFCTNNYIYNNDYNTVNFWLNLDNSYHIESREFSNAHYYTYENFKKFSVFCYADIENFIEKVDYTGNNFFVLGDCLDQSQFIIDKISSIDSFVLFVRDINRFCTNNKFNELVSKHSLLEFNGNIGCLVSSNCPDKSIIISLIEYLRENSVDRIVEDLIIDLNYKPILSNNYQVEKINNDKISSVRKSKIYKKIKSILLNNKSDNSKIYDIKDNEINAVLSSIYFDSDWYVENYPDVLLSDLNALEHYFVYGSKECRNPSIYFNTKFYLSEYPDINDSGINPLVHYVLTGKKEFRAATPQEKIQLEELVLINNSSYFDENWYLSQYPEVRDLGIKPDLHYLLYGYLEGKNPNYNFDNDWYIDFYADVKKINLNPLVHYLRSCDNERRFPNLIEYNNFIELEADKENIAKIKNSPFFDEEFYLKQCKNIEITNMDLAEHYLKVGYKLGLSPSISFDNNFYTLSSPDVKQLNINPLLHYIDSGKSEDRLINYAQFYKIIIDENKLKELSSNNKNTLLIISHEASRSGAPILAYNIIKRLKDKYNIITLPLKGGTIIDNFIEESDLVIYSKTLFDINVEAAKYILECINYLCPIYFSIVNSAGSYATVHGLVENDIPFIYLVHEFAQYYEDNIYVFEFIGNFSAFNIFSTISTKNNAILKTNYMSESSVSVIPQGYGEIPKLILDNPDKNVNLVNFLQNFKQDSFLVLGIGTKTFRKGTDFFLATAYNILKNYPDKNIKFLWVGGKLTYEPSNHYEVYVDFFNNCINLPDKLKLIEDVENLDIVYDFTDVLFLSSRLDPLPNVAIDAMVKKIPIIAFENSGGVSDLFSQYGVAKHYLAPYFDLNKASDLILELYHSQDKRYEYGRHLKQIADNTFNMDFYVEQLEVLGKASRDYLTNRSQDFEIIKNNTLFDRDYFIPRYMTKRYYNRDEAINLYLKKYFYNLINNEFTSKSIDWLRKPFPGFNQLIYAHLNKLYDVDPLAHFIKNDMPSGPWLTELIDNNYIELNNNLKVALHIHAYYVDLVDELINCLNSNKFNCDLFISTCSDNNRDFICKAFKNYKNGNVQVLRVANIGRDVRPMIFDFKDELIKYDIIGHVHTKKSLHEHSENSRILENDLSDFGGIWRNALWQNLVGEKYPMLDKIISKFNDDEKCGIIYSDDPFVPIWGKNYNLALDLAKKLNISKPLPKYHNFPIGTMFWARKIVLEPFFNLNNDDIKYPQEPIPIDGTVLHAIERLFPLVSENLGYKSVMTYLPEFSR